MQELRSDLRFAVRLFARHKRLTLLAVLSMALALGANTAIFGLLEAIVLRPLPVRHPEQLVALRYSTPQATTLTSFSLPVADQLAALPVFDAMLVRSNNSQNVTVAGATQRAMVEIVSENYFTTLGVGAQLGRVFSASPASEEPVAVLSYGYWQRRFGASASAMGARIAINDYPVTVIGVMPPEFDGTDPGVPPDLRVPLRIHPRILPWNAFGKPNQRSFELFARVRAGYTAKQAEAAAQIAYRHDPNIQSRKPAETLHADPAPGGRSRLRNRYQAPLIALQSLLLLCLVLACANVANLLAALSQERQREIAVRLAIGSSRGRLMRQLITEGLLLASVSCALGLMFARWAATLLIGEIPMGLSPVSLQFSLDWRIAAFAWVLTLLTGVAFGCLPAMQSMRTDLVTGLRGSSTSAGGASRSPAILGAVQVAVSLILLSVAALFVRSLRTIEAIDPGYRLDHMIVATVAPSNKWPAPAVDRFYREASTRLSAVNGVRGVGFINNGLLIGNTWTTQVDVAGRASATGADRTFAMDAVTPGFFTVTATRLIVGREFEERDGADAPLVAIVNESAAQDLLGSQALGRRITANGREFEVIGVVQDTRAADLRESPLRAVYFAAAQRRMNPSMSLHVWTVVDPAQMLASVREVLRGLDPSVPVYGEKTMERRRDTNLSSERLMAMLASFTGTLALLLASLGLFAVLAQAVTRRTREFGIRRAVGAPASHVARLVARQSLWIVGIGLIVGIPLTLAATRLARGLLFGLSPWDPAMLGGALVILIGAAAVASALPAIRAARIDPVVALRDE